MYLILAFIIHVTVVFAVVIVFIVTAVVVLVIVFIVTATAILVVFCCLTITITIALNLTQQHYTAVLLCEQFRLCYYENLVSLFSRQNLSQYY